MGYLDNGKMKRGSVRGDDVCTGGEGDSHDCFEKILVY